MEQIAIFRSAKLWEFDMAVDALKRANIPHFARQEDLSGVRTAFGATPSPGVGVTWTLFVPKPLVRKAKKALTGLSLDLNQQPDFWGFNPDPAVKRGLKRGNTIAVWMIGLAIVYVLVQAVISLFK